MRDLKRRIVRLESKSENEPGIVLLYQDAGNDTIRDESGLTFTTEEAALAHFSGMHVVVIQFV